MWPAGSPGSSPWALWHCLGVAWSRWLWRTDVPGLCHLPCPLVCSAWWCPQHAQHIQPLLKTPLLHVFCLLEGKQSLTFQGRKGKARWDAGHSEHGLLGWQQRRVVGASHHGVRQRESRGALSWPVLLGQGWGMAGTSGMWSSYQEQATSGLLLQVLTSACGRDQTLLPAGFTLRSCCCWHRQLRGVSAHTSTLSLQRAIYLPSALPVPASYLRILILICFRIRYILALQHCAAMTTGLHFCCFHTLVFLVLGLFPSSYSLALKTWLHPLFCFQQNALYVLLTISQEVFLVPELPWDGGDLLPPLLDPQLIACVQAFRSSQKFLKMGTCVTQDHNRPSFRLLNNHNPLPLTLEIMVQVCHVCTAKQLGIPQTRECSYF